ncbi:MAG: hypothetical protein KAJ46_05110, partial [Sedimentisphaerales bacterium]|nr:hypothetical protein [Sedimentisphaerales bacterium]
MKKLVTLMVVGTLVLLWTGSPVLGAADGDTETQLQALQTRVAQLEAQLNKQGSNAELLKGMVAQMDSAPAHTAADSALTAGYDKRFFIKSADDQFKLEFDTRLQFRHTYGMSDDGSNDMMQDGTRPAFGTGGVDASASAFELERVRLYLRGHVLKDIKYNICFESDDDSGSGDYLYMYEVSYNFMPDMGVKLGRYKGPFGKQETTSSGRQMLVDRSLANEVFNIDRTTGVELFGTLDMGDIKPNYRIMVFNGLQNNNDAPFSDNDNSPGIAARLAIPMMGATAKDFANESDLKGHETLVSQVGFSFAYSNDRNEDHFAGGGESDGYEFLGKNPDGRSDVYELGGETTLLGIDFAMKSNGLSVIVEGFYQHVDADSGEVWYENDFGTGRNSTIQDPATGDIITIMNMDGYELDNYGWYAQAGYFIVPEKFELVSRVSGVHVDSTNDMYEYAAGWNYYISG